MVSVSAFTVEVKALILKRALFRCERCGVGPASQAHHRRPRRSGGSSDPITGLASNGVALCVRCHNTVESHRKAAAQMGYILGATQDPMAWPIYLWRGWAYLNEDGTLTLLGRVPTLNENRARPSVLLSEEDSVTDVGIAPMPDSGEPEA